MKFEIVPFFNSEGILQWVVKVVTDCTVIEYNYFSWLSFFRKEYEQSYKKTRVFSLLDKYGYPDELTLPLDHKLGYAGSSYRFSTQENARKAIQAYTNRRTSVTSEVPPKWLQELS